MNNYYVIYEIDRISHSVRVTADNKKQVRSIVKNYYGTDTIIIRIEKE